MEQYIKKSALVAEIERRIKTNKECMLGLRNLDYYQGKVDALNDIISFINSLQKEPKECMYSKDNYTDEDRKVLFGDCEEECEFNKKEEPVSEDLEEAAWFYADKKCHLDIAVFTSDEVKKEREKMQFTWQDLYDAVMFGAKWQKTKDESTTEDLGEYINKLSKRFPEVSFAKLSRIAVRVSRWQRNQDTKNKLPEVINRTGLDEYAYQCAYDMSNDWAIEYPTWHDVEDACKLGAKWQEKQDQSTIELAEDHAMLAGMNKMEEQIMKNLWKPADGNDLPEYDREVIVLTQPYPLEDSEFAVYFAHRPDPKGWDGKSITTGEVEHYTPKTYGKGGWNIPDIKWWLDVELPKEIKL